MLREQAADAGALARHQRVRPTRRTRRIPDVADSEQMICGCHVNTPNMRWSERRTLCDYVFRASPFTPSGRAPRRVAHLSR